MVLAPAAPVVQAVSLADRAVAVATAGPERVDVVTAVVVRAAVAAVVLRAVAGVAAVASAAAAAVADSAVDAVAQVDARAAVPTASPRLVIAPAVDAGPSGNWA